MPGWWSLSRELVLSSHGSQDFKSLEKVVRREVRDALGLSWLAPGDTDQTARQPGDSSALKPFCLLSKHSEEVQRINISSFGPKRVFKSPLSLCFRWLLDSKLLPRRCRSADDLLLALSPQDDSRLGAEDGGEASKLWLRGIGVVRCATQWAQRLGWHVAVPKLYKIRYYIYMHYSYMTCIVIIYSCLL